MDTDDAATALPAVIRDDQGDIRLDTPNGHVIFNHDFTIGAALRWFHGEEALERKAEFRAAIELMLDEVHAELQGGVTAPKHDSNPVVGAWGYLNGAPLHIPSYQAGVDHGAATPTETSL